MIAARLDHLNTVCTSLANVHREHEHISQPEARSTDRKLNLVIFGIKEDGDSNIWRRNVDGVVQCVTDHPVEVVDMFRPSRFDSSKIRHVLVTLTSRLG
jgi:hypothetical protein